MRIKSRSWPCPNTPTIPPCACLRLCPSTPGALAAWGCDLSRAGGLAGVTLVAPAPLGQTQNMPDCPSSPLSHGADLSPCSAGSSCPQAGRAVPVAGEGSVLAVTVCPAPVWQPGAEAGTGRAHPWARAVTGPADVRLQGDPEGAGVHPPRPAGNCKFQF